MIKKVYRLKELEVKKVLQKAKPFFSYGLVLNKKQNRLQYNRFAIVIGSKSVNTNIERVFFRRLFYDFITKTLLIKDKLIEGQNEFNYYDYVFVVKKQTKLDKKDEKSINSFVNDLTFLIKNKGKKY